LKKALITQSNYIPWKGYFDALALCDSWVVFDEMQYTRRDWRNRNKVKTSQGPKWLTIPVEVKGKYYQKINETKVADSKWSQSHWGLIKQSYAKAPFFSAISEWLEPLYRQCKLTYLTEINLYFIKAINSYLNIDIELHHSKDFTLTDHKTQRLIDICKEIGATDYYTGSAAKNYMEEELFRKENIKLHYLDYSGYREYPQLYEPFTHEVSILDLLFMAGPDSRKYMKH
jgi:hypothetical protein